MAANRNNGKKPPNKEVSSSRGNTLRWLRENSEAIKIIFIAVAGIVAILEYKSKEYMEKVKISSEFVDKFLTGDGYRSLVRLDEFWMSDHIANLRKNIKDESDSSRYRSVVLERSRSHLSKDILQVIRSLKPISICVIQGRCDYVTVCMHLAQEIQDVRCNYREYIAELSADSGGCVVDEIGHFADKYCSDWIKAYLGVSEYRGIRDNYCLYDKTSNKSRAGDICMTSIIHKRTIGIVDRILE